MYASKVGMMRNIFSPVRSRHADHSSLSDLSFIAQQQYLCTFITLFTVLVLFIKVQIL